MSRHVGLGWRALLHEIVDAGPNDDLERRQPAVSLRAPLQLEIERLDERFTELLEIVDGQSESGMSPDELGQRCRLRLLLVVVEQLTEGKIQHCMLASHVGRKFGP